MKKNIKIMIVILAVLFIGIICVRPILAGTSVSYSVSCYMPHYITLPNGEMVLAEDENNGQEINTAKSQEDNKPIIGEDIDLTQKQEIITLEDKGESQLIMTVCAR